jgi:hypothetical protein
VRISYPISFVYNPKTQIPVTEPPKEVVINVAGKGWKLLRKALNLRIQPAIIDLTNRSNAKYLTARQLRPHISVALNGLDLNYIVTDTIYFNFEKLVSRKMPLTLNLADTVLAEGYQLAGKPAISPASVIVSGPASLVKALPEPYPIHLPDSDIAANYQKKIALGFVPNNLLTPNVEEINVAFEVQKLAKKEIKAQVHVLNRNMVDGGVSLQTSAVKLVYYFLPSDSLLPEEKFVVEADLSKIDPKDSTVAVQVTQKPAAAKTVSVSPKKVKVIY